MSEYIPHKPTGSSPMARFMQAVHEKLWGSGRIVSVPSALVNRTTRGISIIPAAQKTVQAASRLELFRVKSEQVDSLTCRTWDGTNEGETDVTVYKPEELVNRKVQATLLGWHIIYNPLQLTVNNVLTTSANKRFTKWENTDNALLNLNYKEVIWPPYISTYPISNFDGSTGIDNLIYAATDDLGRLVDANLYRHRSWHKEVVVCTKQGTMFALIPSSHVYDSAIDFSTI